MFTFLIRVTNGNKMAFNIRTRLISSEMINDNLYLKESFSGLSESKRNLAIREFSSEERKIILQIIRTNGKTFVSPEIYKKLQNEIRVLNDKLLTTEIPRKDHERHSIGQHVSRLMDNIGYIFNYLTE